MSLVVLYLGRCFFRSACGSVVRYSVRAFGRSFLFDLSRYIFLSGGVMSLVMLLGRSFDVQLGGSLFVYVFMYGGVASFMYVCIHVLRVSFVVFI